MSDDMLGTSDRMLMETWTDIYIYMCVCPRMETRSACSVHWRCKHKLITWVRCSALSSSTQQVTQDSWQRHWFCVAGRGNRSNASYNVFLFFVFLCVCGWVVFWGYALEVRAMHPSKHCNEGFCRLVQTAAVWLPESRVIR